MKKIRVILALLMALLVLGGLFVAVADEGQGSMDVSPGEDEPPVAEPTPEPPVVDPTEPPVEPTDEPTSEPTAEPTDGPSSEPTDEPTSEPTDEPTDGPTDEPTPEPPIDSDNNTGGGDTSNDQGSATRPSVNMGGSIRQPSTSSRRPSSSSRSSGSSGSQAPLEEGPQYVTFARVTQKSNAMSRTLFYGGAACVGTGVLGLIVLAVFIVRGRRVDDREEIFAEIEQSAVRQAVRQPQPVRRAPAAYEEDDPYAQYDRQQGGYEDSYAESGYDDDGYASENWQQPASYAQGYDAPPQSLHRPEPEELAMPVNGSMYTEEFELPPQQDYQPAEPVVPGAVSMYTEEFEPPRQVPPAPGPVVPTQASMYTEEFSLPQDTPQRPAPAPRRPQPRPSSSIPADQMDTTELLREILHGDDK